MTPPVPAERQSQLLRGVLDMCLLAILGAEPAYGYEITKRLADHGLEASDGSVYPLLGRLQRQRLIESYAVPSGSGPPRKYYRTTAEGRDRLGIWTTQWRSTTAAVNTLLTQSEELTWSK